MQRDTTSVPSRHCPVAIPRRNPLMNSIAVYARLLSSVSRWKGSPSRIWSSLEFNASSSRHEPKPSNQRPRVDSCVGTRRIRCRSDSRQPPFPAPRRWQADRGSGTLRRNYRARAFEQDSSRLPAKRGRRAQVPPGLIAPDKRRRRKPHERAVPGGKVSWVRKLLGASARPIVNQPQKLFSPAPVTGLIRLGVFESKSKTGISSIAVPPSDLI